MISGIEVLIVSNREEIRNRTWTLIKLHFQSRIATESSGSRVVETFQRNDPDILLLDLEEQELVQLLGEEGLTGEDIGGNTYVITLGTHAPLETLPEDQRIHVGPNPTAEELLETIEKAAQDLGFFTDQGKITERLVQRQIFIEIQVPEEEVIFEGITTGLNQNGLGARVSLKMEASPDPIIAESASCRVYFRDDDLEFEPVQGDVVRVEESWDDEYDQFLVVSFDGAKAFPEGSRSRRTLEELIDQQNEVSIKRPGINNWF